MRGKRLDPEWRPDENLKHWMRERRPDLLPYLDDVVEAFHDYWAAESGQKAAKLDWDAAFRTWCRREAMRFPRKEAARPTTPSEAAPEPKASPEQRERSRQFGLQKLGDLMGDLFGGKKQS